jgi:uncharacterized protein YjbI with pentapeptide repeats
MEETKSYSGRGWRLANFRSLADAPEWIAAPITVFAYILICGLFVWLIYRAICALYLGVADDIYKILLSLAGVLGAPFVAWRTIVAHQQTSISRESHYTTLFTKAVEQLGATREVKEWVTRLDNIGETQTRTQHNLEVRLGAIYALDRIASDSERDHWPVMEVLCAYVRNPQNSGIALEQGDTDGQKFSENIPNPRVDIQAAITTIGARTTQRIDHERDRKLKINLSNANLQRIILSGDFERTNFSNSDLSLADFSRVRLTGASFDRAKIYSPITLPRDVENLNFRFAYLKGWFFYDRKASRCQFSWATLQNCSFSRSRLFRCAFTRATLKECSFDSSDLTGSTFNNTTLEEVSFEDAILKGASLHACNLRNCAGLKTEQLALAYGDASTVLPDNVARPDNWPDKKLRYGERPRYT